MIASRQAVVCVAALAAAMGWTTTIASAADLVFQAATVAPTVFETRGGEAGIRAIRADRFACQSNKFTISGARVSFSSVSICDLIRIAYNETDYQIIGAPVDPLGRHMPIRESIAMLAHLPPFFYDIEAYAPGPDPPTEEQVREMLRTLLANRFHLASHYESRELSYIALVPAEGGPTIQPAADDCKVNAAAKQLTKPLHLPMCNATIADFTRQLSFDGSVSPLLAQYDVHTIVDMSGLSGKFDIWLPMPTTPDDFPGGFGPALVRGLPAGLGLRLEPRKSAIKVLVVDHVEAPSSN
jgi:uncharacterized protein (TIGR03435 family)